MSRLIKITPLLAAIIAVIVCASAYISLLVVALHWRFSALAVGLMLLGLVLVILLLGHNRLLRGAHREMRQLTSDLKNTASELETANRAVRDTNYELQRQNAALLMRDAELRTQSERFQAALNNMSQGLCMVDSAQNLIVCNEQYRALFVLAACETTPGTPITALSSGADARGSRSALAAVLTEHLNAVRNGAPGSYFQDLSDGRTLSIVHRPMQNGGWVGTPARRGPHRPYGPSRCAHRTAQPPPVP